PTTAWSQRSWRGSPRPMEIGLRDRRAMAPCRQAFPGHRRLRMANRGRLDEYDTGLVTLFARAPQLCASTLAGLGSALWLSVVAPCAGHVAAWGTLVLVNALAVAVVAVLAVLVTTAGTLLAADWRADAASHQAWAEVESAAVEFPPPAWTAAPSQIDPRYF